MKIYMDVSCLNRPFDDQTQLRIRLESEAIIMVLKRIDSGQWTQVSSRMADIEINAIPDAERRMRVLRLLPTDTMELTPSVFERAKILVERGLRAADAVHVAAAEALHADVFLICDYRLVRGCFRIRGFLKVEVHTPDVWFNGLLEEHDHAQDTE